MNNLPPNWSCVKLGDVCIVVTDGTHKTPNYVERGIRFIAIKNIKPFKPIDWDSYVKYITEEEHKQLIKRTKPEKDDILFPRIGTLGYAKIIDFDEEVSIFVGLGLAKPIKEKVVPKFLEFYLNTPFVNKYSHNNATGTGRLTLPLAASRILPVPLPPLSMQKEIVEMIEQLLSALENGIASLKKAKEQIILYRQSVLNSAFNGKLICNGNINEKTGLL